MKEEENLKVVKSNFMEEQKITKKEKIKMFFRKPRISFLWVIVFLVIGGVATLYITRGGNGGTCNVVGINLHGSLYTYIPEHAEGDTDFDYDSVASEDLIGTIAGANDDPNIKAIVIEVDSGGGSPIGGEEISNEIKNSEKPIVAFIRETGASASYLAISSADRIWASEYSNIGSIGVTQSYLNNTENNKKEGYTYEKLSAGKFKDSGSPDLALTKEEKDLFMRDINIIYQNFIEAVSVNRNISIEEVKKMADGSTVLGEKAKELGLIDEIGGIDEVTKYLEEQIGETPNICW